MDLSQWPSDSSYSQTNIPAPSSNHNLLNVASQLESDSAEHCVPARSHNRKALNWRPNEDIALCQSWVRCSENLIIGTSPAGNSLWSRIFEDFCEQLPGTTRTKKSLENRWTAIQDDVTKWKTIVNRVHKDRSGSGGTNLADEWGVCYKAFRDDHTRAFKFYHCWEILHHSVKWNDASSRKCEGNPVSRSDAVNTPPPLASHTHDDSGSMDLSQPSSGSLYSQTNILAPPPNVVTQLESNSAEHSSVPARAPNRKALNWRPNEDIALCQAWVRCSENLIIGTSQTAYSLWNRIYDDFCEQLPGTTRTKKSLENRWSPIQDDVTKWKTIVNRVHKDRSGGTTTADEWGVCYKAFRDDHTRDFKFYHCWEVLHHSVKWNDTYSGKSQDKPYSGSDPVNAPPPPASSPMHDPAGIDLDGLHDSSSMPSSEEDDPSLPSTPTEPTLSSIPSEALESPSGSESVREKRRRIEEAVHDNRLMDQFFECIKMQQRQIQMLQEVNMTQFEGSTKPVNECHSFHLVKKIKLEQLKLSVDIIQAIGDTEGKMIIRAPHLMSNEVSDGRVARFKKLHELERELYEIWQLQYSPVGNAR